MAKGKTKRKTAAKNARKKKAENPTMDDRNNPVAKFAQSTGSGFHGAKSKDDKKRKDRRDSKKDIKQQTED